MCATHGVTNNLNSQFGHAQKSAPMLRHMEKRRLIDLYRPVTVVGIISHDNFFFKKRVEPWCGGLGFGAGEEG